MPRSMALAGRIGIVIRLLRRERTTLSQENFGRLIGVHRTYIGQLELGRANPTVELLERVAKGIGVSVSDIVRRAEALPVAKSKRTPRRARLRVG